MSLKPESFRPERALITGGAGFIGSHLAEHLLERGIDVMIIDDLSTGRFKNIEHLTKNPRFRFAIDTITNDQVMDRLVSECSIIYHLAAAVGVRLIVEQPVHTIETNITGTEAVLRAAQRYRVKVMIASTSEVYGKGNAVPFKEDDDVVLGPTSRNRWSYAASKMVDEFLGLAYHYEKKLPVTIFRLFNTVGPRQTGQYGMVIPRFVQQAKTGEKITVYADGQQSRCFMHVSDAVRGIYDLSIKQGADGEVFNIGSTEETTVLELAQKVLGHVRGIPSIPPENDPQISFIPYEDAYTEGFEDMRRRVPDISKIGSLTGWKPSLTLEDILRDIVSE